MRKRTTVAALLVPLLAVAAIGLTAPAPAAQADFQDFVMGADLGLLPEMEANGCQFFENGSAKDAVDLLGDAGINMGRVRLWADPYSSTGAPYGGGTNDLASTIALAQRMKDAGMAIMLDIHYSDWWADPTHQKKPKAWASLSTSALVTEVHDYTEDVILAMKAAGVLPDMVQIGNELTSGMLFPTGAVNSAYGTVSWSNLAALINAGIDGVNDALSPGDNVETILHLDNGGYNHVYRWWFDEIIAAGVTDFDIIGLSYYPFWHGTVAGMTANVNDISVRYNKDVMIVEGAQAFTSADYDFGNVANAAAIAASDYPGSIQGQTDYLRDMVDILKAVPNGHGRGFVWWEPTWRGCPTAAPWGFQAGINYGLNPGTPVNSWDNLALFDYNGRPLSSLEVFGETTEANWVANPGFEFDPATTTPSYWYNWTQNPADSNAIYTEGASPQLSGSFKLTHWKATAYKASTSQSISLPNGHYRVSAWVRSGGGQNYSFMFVRSSGASEVRQNLPAGISDWQLVTLEVTVTTGTLELGFYSDANAGNWINVDSVRVSPSL